MNDTPVDGESTTILLVDDETSTRSALAELLRDEGYTVRTTSDGFKALGTLDGWEPEVLLTDVQMPGMSGIDLMARVREQAPRVATVVMTAFGTVENALLAMKAGADAYLVKPIQFAELLLVLERIHDGRDLREENEQLRQRVERQHSEKSEELGWIGDSRPAREFVSLLRQLAANDAPVLIRGERGAGKQFSAQLLHDWSERSEGPFVSVPCRSIEESSQPRELFGDGLEGQGLVGNARGGTLLLRDIEELSSTSQARLRDVLQQQADADQEPRLRVIATTRLDLELEMNEGRVLDDLYYTLNALSVRVPSLRQRRDDILELALHFAKIHATQHRKYIRGFTARSKGALLGYAWPGNVRQLEMVVQRAVQNAGRRDIEPKDLPRDLMRVVPSDQTPEVPGATMAEVERYAILRTLEHMEGSTKRAAQMLGISTRKIQYRLNEYRDEGLLPPGEEEDGSPGDEA